MALDHRIGAAAGVAGPVCFVGGWLTASTIRPGYSNIHDAISQLARLGAPHRGLMTAAFVGFGVAMPAFAPTLAEHLAGGRRLQAAVTLAGAATLGVAAFPLSKAGGETEDLAHATCATLAYIGTALSPILGGLALREAGKSAAARTSIAIGVASAVALATTAFANNVGIFQRAGLTIVDAWYVATAAVILTGGTRRTVVPAGPAPARPGPASLAP